MVLLPSYLFSAFNPNKLPNKAQVMDNLGLKKTYMVTKSFMTKEKRFKKQKKYDQK